MLILCCGNMSCVMCESHADQISLAVDVFAVTYRLLKNMYVHLLVCYLNKYDVFHSS